MRRGRRADGNPHPSFSLTGPWGFGLGGICTQPDARGRGIASGATAALRRVALAAWPVATRHVDPRDVAAIRAYEQAGLRRAGEFRLTFR